MRTKIKTLDRFTETKLMYSRKMVEYQEFLDTVYGGKVKTLRDTLESKTTEDQAARIQEYHRTKIGIRKYDIFHLNLNPCVDKVADFMESWLKVRGLSVGDPAISKQVQPLTEYVNKFDQIMAIGLLRPLLDAHKAETVVWRKDIWDMAINAEGLTEEVTLDPRAFPLTPQFWVPDTQFDTSVNLMMSESYGFKGIVDGTVTGKLEAVYLYPVPLDTVSMSKDEVHQIWVAACFVRVNGAIAVLPSPLMSFSTLPAYNEEIMEKLMSDLLYKTITSTDVANILTPTWASQPEVDSSGDLVTRPAVSTMAKAVLSAMLFMNESYIGVDRRNVCGDGLVRIKNEGVKKVRHISKISHVELRRPMKRVTGETRGGRNYTCQWIVRGHWRKYKQPTKEGRTLVRIADYIKGPEDAPMKQTIRVITVSR